MQPKLHSASVLVSGLLGIVTIFAAVAVIMRFSQPVPSLFAALTGSIPLVAAQWQHGSATGHHQPGPEFDNNASSSDGEKCPGSNQNVSLSWHPPASTAINNLSTVINGTGVYGFIFNTSQGPLDTYDWCNMPHTNPATYPRVTDPEYELTYVEVIHRHHKRTPYASNSFPHESYPWYCSDEGLFYGGKPLNPTGNASAQTYWSVYTSPSNPLAPAGFNGTCQFPQITRGGLDDSHQHGVDLKAVYATLLDFIPADYDSNSVAYRVTNNVITSQVASMLIAGMYPSRGTDVDTPLLIQSASIDSLEPAYSCASASALFSSYATGSTSAAWQAHLQAAAPLAAKLDSISGVSPSDQGWHQSYDHYFDNLSARLCHAKPLPCKIGNASDGVTQAEADEVFRLGEYEYSFTYRDAEQSLAASVGSYGIWMAELAENLRHAMNSAVPPATNATVYGPNARYRHNVAHDGSVSRVLAILQIERMVWPGMGSEIVFELYNKKECFYLRVLWGGQILKSSHPAFGTMDMIPVATFLTYIDGLVGVGANKIPGICSS